MFLRKKPAALTSATDMYVDVQHSDSGGGRESSHGRQNTVRSDRDLGSGRDRGNSESGGLYGGRGRGKSEREGRGRGKSEKEGRERGNSEREGRGRGNSERGGRGRGNSERGGRGRGNSEREGRGRGSSEREGRGRGSSERGGRGRGKSERGNSERADHGRGNSERGGLYEDRGRENSDRGLYGGRGRGGKGSNIVSDRGSYSSSQRQESNYNQGRNSYTSQRNEGGSYMDQQGRKGTYDDGRGPSRDSRERGGGPYRPGMGGGISLPDFPDRDKAFSQGKTSYMDSRERMGSYKQGGSVGRSLPDFQRRNENANQSRSSYMQKQNRMEPYKQRGMGGDFYMDSQRKRGFSQDDSTYRLMGSTSSMGYENIRSDPFLDRPRGDISLSMDRERGGNRTFMDSHIGSSAPYMDPPRTSSMPFMGSQRGLNAPLMDPQRGLNAPRMDPQRGLNAPRMDPLGGFNLPRVDSQRGLNVPRMDSQRGFNAPRMDSQRGFNAPVMDSQREVNTPFVDQQRGVDTPFMGQERSGRRDEPVTGGLSREEKQIALGILEQIIVKKKESDANQRRQQERKTPSSRERHQERETPSSRERHQSFEAPSSYERHQEFEPPSSYERHQEFEPPSSYERHQEFEPPSSYERHQEFESPSSYERHQEFEPLSAYERHQVWQPYPSQMVNVQSQIQVRDLDSLERAAEMSDTINDLFVNRRFKAAAQLSKKLKRVGKKNLTVAEQFSNVKSRVGKRNTEVTQFSNVKDRIGKRTIEMADDYDYEDFAPPNKMARSSVLSRLGPKITQEVPTEIYGPDLRNLDNDQLENLLDSLEHHDKQLSEKVLHCDLCAPFRYSNRTYPKVGNYIRHHFQNEHIELEESYKRKIKATLTYLSIEAKLGYMRRHGTWDTTRKGGLCNLCHVPKGKGEKTHMNVTECWMYHEYTHPKNCCYEGQFNSRNEYFYHTFTIKHLWNEAHYREAQSNSIIGQQKKMEAFVKKIAEGSTTDAQGIPWRVFFRDSLLAKEVEIYGGFSSTPMPPAVEQLLKLYARNKDRGRPKRASAPFIEGREIQYKWYDPSILTGRYNIIFTTEIVCSVCVKDLGRSKQSIIDHCATQEHYDATFDKINELRKEKDLEPFTKKEPTSNQTEENNMDEEESTNSQKEENNMDVNDDPCTEEKNEKDEDNMVDVEDVLKNIYTKKGLMGGRNMVVKDVCWKRLMERWATSNRRLKLDQKISVRKRDPKSKKQRRMIKGWKMRKRMSEKRSESHL